MVRAKTGFISGASALSGVAMTDDERFFAFSVLVEYPAIAGLNREVWKPMQDRICEAIVRGP
jgi:D-alanyl-D-alanine carboxypeptidase